jgi:hypothetical protein
MRRISIVLFALVVAAVTTWQLRGHAEGVGTTIFPLSLSGKSYQPQVRIVPGKCLGCGKVTDKAVTAVLQGTLDDFAKDFLPLDPSGHVFLYYDGLDNWRLATNTNGSGTVPLAGAVANDGTFWMMGGYNFGTAGTIFAVGKVSFTKKEPDPFEAKSIKGTMYFFSSVIDTGLVMKFKTGKPVS